jgi:protoporphyrinogen oxidase
MHPTRRDILASFLGLPAVLAAGCGATHVPAITGSIVGASDTLGHRLREAKPRPPAEDAWQCVPVLIIGGGIAGLSAAWRFLRAGLRDFCLVELERDLGGTSRWGQRGALAHPWGAHYLPAPLKENRALLTLLDEMGVVEEYDREGEPVFAENVLCRDPHERLFHRGRWYEGLYLHAGATPDDLVQWQRFQKEVKTWAAWRDRKERRAFTTPTAVSSDDAEVTALDKLTMAEWLDQRDLRSSRLRWMVEYACRDDYGSTLDQTSAWAGLFYYASRLRGPDSEPQPLLTWPEGNGRIVRHFAQQLPRGSRLEGVVVDLAPVLHDGKPEVEAVVQREDGSIYGVHVERVIFAAPQFVAPYVIRGYRQERGAVAREFEYGSWMVANLSLRNRPAEEETALAWDNVLYESPSLGYVVSTHQSGIDHGPTVFTYYYPLCDDNPRSARERLLSLAWGEWSDIALTDLGRAHPDLRNLVENLDVMRWGHAMIRPRPGFVWGTARRQAALPFHGIHFAHSDLSGVALFEEAFDQGLRAAEEVLAARGIRQESLR